MAKTINILGQKYKYSETTVKDDSELSDCDGYVEKTKKRIVVNSDIDTEYMKRKIRRHECLHAFFHESGLDAYSADETLVDYIANVFPKLLKTFKKVNAI